MEQSLLIHLNEQSTGVMREFVEGMTADALFEESRYDTRDAMMYCLASAKLLELLEQKERDG